MSSVNIPAADKGVLSHGEELAMSNALHDYLTANPSKPCVWKSDESCRTCGLYEKCFTLEANHGAA